MLDRHRILVGFDGSPSSQSALEWARATARLWDATLTVIGVVSTGGSIGTAQLAQIPGAESRIGDIERAVQQAVGQDVPVSIRRGRPAEELVTAAEDADLLVVGARGVGGVRALLLGSVSRACLHHARCTVAVVHAERPGRPRAPRGRVVVGVDGSVCARRALRAAAEEAHRRGAGLTAVHAVGWEHKGFALLAPSTEQLLAWGRELLAAELRRADVAARPVVRPGHAAQVLTRAAARADLLVLGSAGHNTLVAVATGSTTDICAQRVRCPLLVVR